MSGFTTKIDLLQSSVFIKELKVKHFKTILKTLLGDTPSVEDVLINLVNILTDTTTLSVDEIYNLSVLDFLIIVIELRSVSIGGTIQLEITEQKNFKFDFNLEKAVEVIKKLQNNELVQNIDNFKIVYRYPSVKDYFLSAEEDKLLILKRYIKEIHISNHEFIEIFKLDDNVFIELFEALPANISAKIFKHITDIVQHLNQINLLDYLINKNLSLHFSKDTFVFILQILFSKNLYPLYENIFALAKFANLSPSYIEECTPGEYTIFVKLLEQILKEQNSQQKSANILPPINTKNPEFV
jgi:hypothetical protein